MRKNWTKNQTTPPSKPKAPKAKVWRPKAGELAREIDRINDSHRPITVPQGALTLVAFVDLPGENTQRSNHHMVNARWKEQVKSDFLASLECQFHPGFLPEPRIHALSLVARAGDEINHLSRLKYLIDLLQAHKVDSRGKRVQGLLNLIEKDDVLKREHVSTVEVTTGIITTDTADRFGRPIKITPRKVILWLWSAP